MLAAEALKVTIWEAIEEWGVLKHTHFYVEKNSLSEDKWKVKLGGYDFFRKIGGFNFFYQKAGDKCLVKLSQKMQIYFYLWNILKVRYVL